MAGQRQPLVPHGLNPSASTPRRIPAAQERTRPGSPGRRPFSGVSHDLTNHQPVQWINAAFFRCGEWQLRHGCEKLCVGPAYGDVDVSSKITSRFMRDPGAVPGGDFPNLFNRRTWRRPRDTSVEDSARAVTPLVITAAVPGIGPGEPFNTQVALKILF